MRELKRHPNRYFHDYQERLEPAHIEKWMGEVQARVLAAKTEEE